MSYQSLYRRYRPNSIRDVVSQEHIMEVLIKSIEKDKISHAYLFCGPRGTGKTSIAKLFARAINCANKEAVLCGTCDNCRASEQNNHPDIVEIDAASNNGVDEIRALIERVKYMPILGKYKVYIIDEVHMLSQGAFNALLKTLEEPPEHVVFILATTEIHKVLPTIVSRCQRFDFTRIPNDAIAKRLDYILECESVVAEQGVTATIASLSGGGLRNALTILEQAIVLADETITVHQIYDTNGMITPEEKKAVFLNILDNNLDRVMQVIKSMQAKSVQFDRLTLDLATNIKDSIILSHTKDVKLIDENNLIFIEFLHQRFSINERLAMIDKLLAYAEKMKQSQDPTMYFDVVILELFSDINRNQNGLDSTPTEASIPVIPQSTLMKPSVESEQDAIIAINDTQFDFVDERDVEAPFEADIHEDREEDSVVSGFEMDELTLIRFMVSADKAMRKHDAIKYENRVRYRLDPSWARPARLLGEGQLVMSGSYFVVVAMKNELEVKELLESRNQAAILEFSKELFGEDKHIIAISTDFFQASVETFKKLASDQRLPQNITKEEYLAFRPHGANAPQDETLHRIQSLFGDDLEIVE